MKVQSRKIGVEFEFDSSWSNLKKSASKHIKSIYGKNQYYSHPDSFKSDFKTDKWHIKEDTSGLSELTTPISKKKDIKNIVKVIKRIHKDGITVSKDCSLMSNPTCNKMIKIEVMNINMNMNNTIL
jgi:hypothetical protein